MKGTRKMLPTVFNVAKTPKKDSIHQAEKPIALFEELLDYITLPNELVLDLFAGSANLGQACSINNVMVFLLKKTIPLIKKLKNAWAPNPKNAYGIFWGWSYVFRVAKNALVCRENASRVFV